MNVKFDFSGKTALVTGGGSGIGRATVNAFADAGANVAVADIDREAGEDLVRSIREAGGSATFFSVDVADEESVRAMIDALVQTFGSLDIAHNNAGIEGKTVPLCDVPSDNWRRVVDVDLSSVFYCMKAEIEQMTSRRYLSQPGGVQDQQPSRGPAWSPLGQPSRRREKIVSAAMG